MISENSPFPRQARNKIDLLYVIFDEGLMRQASSKEDHCIRPTQVKGEVEKERSRRCSFICSSLSVPLSIYLRHHLDPESLNWNVPDGGGVGELLG
jgi:hypothetical protein